MPVTFYYYRFFFLIVGKAFEDAIGDGNVKSVVFNIDCIEIEGSAYFLVGIINGRKCKRAVHGLVNTVGIVSNRAVCR